MSIGRERWGRKRLEGEAVLTVGSVWWWSGGVVVTGEGWFMCRIGASAVVGRGGGESCRGPWLLRWGQCLSMMEEIGGETAWGRPFILLWRVGASPRWRGAFRVCRTMWVGGLQNRHGDDGRIVRVQGLVVLTVREGWLTSISHNEKQFHAGGVGRKESFEEWKWGRKRAEKKWNVSRWSWRRYKSVFGLSDLTIQHMRCEEWNQSAVGWPTQSTASCWTWLGVNLWMRLLVTCQNLKSYQKDFDVDWSTATLCIEVLIEQFCMKHWLNRVIRTTVERHTSMTRFIHTESEPSTAVSTVILYYKNFKFTKFV